ncbi:MAG: PIG-L family deacetylase, partial [Elusimicrobiota bacterium]
MNILAIGAHPDDLEYGCGGTLIKFHKKKHNISLLVMTKGEIGGDPQIREKEQLKTTKILGAKIFWGNCEDTKIS